MNYWTPGAPEGVDGPCTAEEVGPAEVDGCVGVAVGGGYTLVGG